MLTSRNHRHQEIQQDAKQRVSVCAFMLASVFFQSVSTAQVVPQRYVQNAQPAVQYAQPVQYGQYARPTVHQVRAVTHRIQPVIQQAQYAPGSSRKPLPTPIAKMPEISEDLEVIQSRSQLIVTRTSIRRIAIADPGVIDVVQYSPNELSIIGLSIGSTNLTFWFEGSSEPLIYLVKVIRDPSLEDQERNDYGKLERKLAILFPNSKVYLIPLSRKIVVRGQARDAEEAAQILSIVRGEFINRSGDLGGPQPYGGGGSNLGGGRFGQNFNNNDQASSFIINQLEVPHENQIMLHVRIAELNRSHLRRLGIDLNLLIKGGRHVLSSTVGGTPSTLAGIFENGEISVLVNWLASNGTAKILSEPTIVTMSGHPASFLSGGEFPVPTIVGVGGAAGTSTTFRGFGTSVFVTPTLIDHDLIRMRITPEFSAINGANGGGGVQGLDTRRVTTTVQLREGQTMVLAGLLSNQTSTEVTRIPWFGELPVIGPTLFNAKQASQDQTELLILVTPEIIRPMEPDEVPPMPGHEVTHPNDLELYRYAMTEGAPDTGVYQLGPYGSGADYGVDVGYSIFNPPAASPNYQPQPTAPFGGMPGPMTQRGPAAAPYNSYPQQPAGRPGNYPAPAPTQPNQPGLVPTPDPASSQSSQSARFAPSSSQYATGNPAPGVTISINGSGVFPSGPIANQVQPMQYQSPPTGYGRRRR